MPSISIYITDEEYFNLVQLSEKKDKSPTDTAKVCLVRGLALEYKENVVK